MIFYPTREIHGSIGLQRSTARARARSIALGLALALLDKFSFGAGVNVLTYHNDTYRTGWNRAELTLNPSNVNDKSFGWLYTVPLKDQVDGQPLVVSEQRISGGIHTVVYLADESNTIYAIDASNGAILQSSTLGNPVSKLLGCGNNGPQIGVNSSPTIDLADNALYVMAYVTEDGEPDGEPVHKLFSLDLSTLQPRAGYPVQVSATETLADGHTLKFDSHYQRQRAALLDANGRIYAAFGALCDFKAAHSRGWLISWDKQHPEIPAVAQISNHLDTLPPTATPRCPYPGPNNPNSETPCYLSSIWMSGFGPAADARGSIYFVTGNSAPRSYDSALNLTETVVRLTGTLKVEQLFTPANADVLDAHDGDFGSGGIMLAPDQPGAFPHLAFAAGKDGRLWVLNRDNLGGHQAQDVPAFVNVKFCMCGPSYFETQDGGRVVTSGGSGTPELWKVSSTVVSGRAVPSLSELAQSRSPVDMDTIGSSFFTSISSNGTQPHTAIIWAVSRPNKTTKRVSLYAYDATPDVSNNLPLLWSKEAGSWSNIGGNANIVTTIANGLVFVASDIQVEVFGPITPEARAMLKVAPPQHSYLAFSSARSGVIHRETVVSPGAHYWGTVAAARGEQMRIILRNGTALNVDISAALKNGTAKIPPAGRFVEAQSSTPRSGDQFRAEVVNEVQASPESFPPDRDP